MRFCRRIPLLVWLLVVAAALPALGATPTTTGASDLRADESVALFATTAHFVAPGAERGAFWRVPLHAWVHERESDSLWRRPLFWALRRKLGLKAGSEQSRLFRTRARPFLADNERGKVLRIAIAGRTHSMPASDADGHVRGVIEVLAARELGPASTLRTQVSAPDGRVFEGVVHLPAPEGVTVVSDLDDTVKISQVHDRRELLRNTFLREFRVVEGLAKRYSTWAEQGARFEYLSSSPWQLYAPLEAFLRDSGFPEGSLHLKSLRLKDESFLSLFDAPEATKIPALEELLATHPGRRFVLVGDSGERDPEIYAEIARRHPKRIARILIREIPEAPMTETRQSSAFDGLPEDRVALFREASELPGRPW